MKKLTYLNIIILVIFNFTFEVGKAQENHTMQMTLGETVDMALKNNWQVRRSQEYLGVTKGELKQANVALLPKVQLSETFVTTNDPLSAFGFKLKQSDITSEDFDPGTLNDPARISNYTTKVEVQQPLLNLDGIMARKAANLSLQATKENLEWTYNLTTLQAKRLYFNLQLAGKQKEVVLHSLQTAKAGYAVTLDLADQGMVNQADLLQSELRVTEMESLLIEAENQIVRANGDLIHFLNLPPELEIIAVDSIRIIEVPDDLLIVDQIPKSRSDLTSLSLQLEASDRLFKSSKSSFLPRFNAFGSYEWNDTNLFGTQASNYTLGGKLQWDLFQGGSRRGKIQKAAAQRNLAELAYQEKFSAAHQRLTRVQNEVTMARKQLEVAKLALTQAEASFKIRNDRYEEGLEKTADLLESESNLMEKKLDRIKSLNQYQQLVFDLEVLLEEDIVSKKIEDE